MRHKVVLSVWMMGSLCVGAQDLPNDKAESINGKKLDFPSALRGEIATCVFGFGNNSSDRVGIWLESLSSEKINAWSVVNLETIPVGARGVLRMTMRKGTPKELLGRSLVISKDYKAWLRILEVERETLPVLVLFDADGSIVWKKQGTFSATILDELKNQIALLKARR